VAFAIEHYQMTERQACKLVDMDRSSYRYEPRPDHNAELRQELVKLARQYPRYGYRRLHVLLERRTFRCSAQRVYRLYREEGLIVRRLKRKRLCRVPTVTHLLRPNQEWALDFACDALATGRGIRVLAVVDAFNQGMPFLRSRHKSVEPSRDAVAGSDHRTARTTGGDSVR